MILSWDHPRLPSGLEGQWQVSSEKRKTNEKTKTQKWMPCEDGSKDWSYVATGQRISGATQMWWVLPKSLQGECSSAHSFELGLLASKAMRESITAIWSQLCENLLRQFWELIKLPHFCFYCLWNLQIPWILYTELRSQFILARIVLI